MAFLQAGSTPPSLEVEGGGGPAKRHAGSQPVPFSQPSHIPSDQKPVFLASAISTGKWPEKFEGDIRKCIFVFSKLSKKSEVTAATCFFAWKCLSFF